MNWKPTPRREDGSPVDEPSRAVAAARVAGGIAMQVLRDLGDLVVLVFAALVAAILDRDIDDDARDSLRYIGGVLLVGGAAATWVWWELPAPYDVHAGVAVVSLVCLAGYAFTWKPPDPREDVVGRLEDAVEHKAKTAADLLPRGTVRNTEWDPDRISDPKTRGLTTCTLHYGGHFNDGNDNAMKAFHQQVESNLGAPVDWKPHTPHNYVRITVKGKDQTATDRPVTWPLAKADQVDVWQPIPVGFDEAGQVFHVDLFQHNVLVAGVMGYGKSTAMQLFAAATALDEAGAAVDFMDGKLIEMRRWSYIAGRFVSITADGDVDVKGGIELLDDLLAEVQRRRLFLDRSGEQKLRKAHGIPLRLTVIDELAEFLDDPKYGAEFVRKLKSVVRLGRALGLPIVAGITRPSAETFKTDVRDLFDIRMSFKAMTPASRAMALGRSDQLEEPDRPGVCWVLDHRANLRKIKAYFLTVPQMTAIANRGIRLRGGNPKTVRARVDDEFQRLIAGDDGDAGGAGQGAPRPPRRPSDSGGNGAPPPASGASGAKTRPAARGNPAGAKRPNRKT